MIRFYVFMGKHGDMLNRLFEITAPVWCRLFT